MGKAMKALGAKELEIMGYLHEQIFDPILVSQPFNMPSPREQAATCSAFVAKAASSASICP